MPVAIGCDTQLEAAAIVAASFLLGGWGGWEGEVGQWLWLLLESADE